MANAAAKSGRAKRAWLFLTHKLLRRVVGRDQEPSDDQRPREASSPFAFRRSVRQRNFGTTTPSTASAIQSPRSGANLNAWPDPPVATTSQSRSGSGAIQKC